MGMDGDVLHGTYGVLAYDEGADRVQCHACGEWYRMLSGEHLAGHGLTAAAYKRRYELDRATPLESPRVTALRVRNRALAEVRNAGTLPVPDDTLHGERGVLAYDELADRIQCHACGRWFHKLTAGHLNRHGLTISEYKELYGLNMGTALETVRITELRRRQAEQSGAADRLVPVRKGSPAPGAGHGYKRRAEYRRTYYTPERLAELNRRRQRWSDEEMLAALRAAQAAAGGVLTRYYLDRHRPEESDDRYPRSLAVVRRFGSWRRVCELLGQPYRSTRLPLAPGEARQWTDEEIIARLCDLRRRRGGVLTTADIRRNTSRRKGVAGDIPSYRTIYVRFGSWRHVRTLMDARDAAGDGRDG